jgi:hypothetical protein
MWEAVLRRATQIVDQHRFSFTSSSIDIIDNANFVHRYDVCSVGAFMVLIDAALACQRHMCNMVI